jgi:hypothetical protein
MYPPKIGLVANVGHLVRKKMILIGFCGNRGKTLPTDRVIGPIGIVPVGKGSTEDGGHDGLDSATASVGYLTQTYSEPVFNCQNIGRGKGNFSTTSISLPDAKLEEPRQTCEGGLGDRALNAEHK